MSDITSDKLDLIKQRLEILIFLQLRMSDVSEMTMGKQIALLKRLGLTNNEIANLFGVSASYVSSELVRQRRIGNE
jgi:hypothetical protein